MGRLDGRVGPGRAHGDPHVGLGQGRRVVDAVPDHGHDRPLGLEPPDHLDLFLRQTLGPVLDAELGRQGACDPLVVAGQQQHPPDAERPEPPQGRGDLRAERVGDGDEPEKLVVLGQIHDGAASGLERVHTIDGHGRNLDGLPRHQPHAAARDGMPVDARHDALPGDHVEPLGGGEREASSFGFRQHRGGNRVLGVPLDGRRAGEHLGLPQAIEAQHVRHPWRPEGHGPGLVHDDGVHLRQSLQPPPPFDDEAPPGRSPDAGQHDRAAWPSRSRRSRRPGRPRPRRWESDPAGRSGARPPTTTGM